MPLYTGGGIGGGFTVESGVPLFISGASGVAVTGGLTLFTGGVASGSAGLPLYTRGTAGTELTGGITLFAAGQDARSSGTPLYAAGSAAASSTPGVPLYMLGAGPASSGETLYTHGWYAGSGQRTLFIDGGNWSSGNAPLHTVGIGAPSRGMAMSLYGGDVPAASGGFSLSTRGTAGSGWAAGATLHLYSDPSGNVAGRQMPLSLLGSATDLVTRNVNLWVAGENKSAAYAAPLFVLNEQSGVHSALSMVVSGDGSAAGALPYGRGMNLTLARDFGGVTTLFTQGPGAAAASGATLFVAALVGAAGQFPMSVAKVVGAAAAPRNLFTHGW